MSKVRSSDCVDCGLPCLGQSCPHWERVDYYCDNCNDYAEYTVDGEELCEKCTEDYIKEVASSLSIYEKAELLGIDLKRIWE